MSSAKKPDKRIVSRGEYAWLDLKTLGVGLSGFGLFVAAIICGLVTVVTTVALFFELAMWIIAISTRQHRPEFLSVSILTFGCIPVFGAVTYALAKLASKGMEYDATHDVVPFSQADTKHLPASDSQVRASQEPAQAQETILLRAAADAPEHPQEQLLRAAAGESGESEAG